MKIAVGHSIDPMLDVAMEEIISRCEQQLGDAQPGAAILYACIDCDHQQILDTLAERWPGLPLVGCTTDGELSSQMGFQEDSISLMLFSSEKIDFQVTVARDLSQGMEASIAQALAEVPQDTHLCFALPESLTVSGASVVRSLQNQLGPGVTLFGGSAADQWSFERTHQFFGQEILEDSAPLLLFCGDLHVSSGISSGWSPMGEGGTVTRSQGNQVFEINHHSALSFYRTYLGDHITITQEYPLGVFEEPGSDQYYMRAPMSYDAQDQSITFAGDVPEGSRVFITEAARGGILSACEESITTAHQNFQGDPQAALVISCAARKQVLGTRTRQEHEALKRLIRADLPVLGFYSYGEIAPLPGGARAQFHNETFVTVLLGD